MSWTGLSDFNTRNVSLTFPESGHVPGVHSHQLAFWSLFFSSPVSGQLLGGPSDELNKMRRRMGALPF